MMLFHAGKTIAMPRPEADGTYFFKCLGTFTSSTASAVPTRMPMSAAQRAVGCSASMPFTSISDTFFQTIADGAGKSLPPSTSGVGTSRLNNGTMT